MPVEISSLSFYRSKFNLPILINNSIIYYIMLTEL